MEREMDLAEIEEYKETQRLLDEGVVGYLPEKISNRMLKRLVRALRLRLLLWRVLPVLPDMTGCACRAWLCGSSMNRCMRLVVVATHTHGGANPDPSLIPFPPQYTQIPFISMPLLGAGGMFGFYLYLAKNTDVRFFSSFPFHTHTTNVHRRTTTRARLHSIPFDSAD